MTRFGWRDGVIAATAAGRTVLLDTREWRYIGVPPRVTRVLERLNRDGTDDQDGRAALADLIQSGMLVERDAGEPPHYPGPSRAPGADDARVTPGLVVAAFAAQTLSRLLLPTVGMRGVHRLLCGARVPSIPPTADEERAMLRASTAIAATEIVFTRRDRCLARSLALRLLCRWLGLEVHMVVGVRPVPFAAHSWVQSGDLLLNDDLDEVATFMPMLAV